MNMLALFPEVDPHTFHSDRIRIHAVRGETVRGLMPNRDCVVVVPTEQYICEGVYLIAENGWEGLARCERLFAGGDEEMLAELPLLREVEAAAPACEDKQNWLSAELARRAAAFRGRASS